MTTFLRREEIAHPATGEPIVVSFSEPERLPDHHWMSGGLVYRTRVTYQGRNVEAPYYTTTFGQFEPHAVEVLQALADNGLIGDLTFEEFRDGSSSGAEHSEIVRAYRQHKDLTRRLKRVFADDYASLIDTDWDVHRSIHGPGREIYRKETA